MSKIGKILFLELVAISFFLVSNLSGNEFLVDPSIIKVDVVAIGKDFELKISTGIKGYFLSIDNRDDKPSKYTVEILSCEQYGCSPYFGYNDIPDIKWIKIKSPEILVPAKQTGYVKNVFVKIPKKKKYYNQRWQAIVKVLKKPSTGEMINLEVVLPLWIETESKIKQAR